MRRKVAKVGPSSLMVSLPNKWTKEYGIEKGDDLDIFEDEGKLIISKGFKPQEKSGEIFINFESKRYVRSYIGRLYRYGYTNITIRYDNPVLLKDITAAVNALMGADIMDMDENVCKIRIFPVDESVRIFDKYLVKMIHTLKYMIEIISNDIKEGKYNNEPTLNELRNNNWKIKDYILRNAFLQKVPYEEFNIITIVFFAFEKMGTELIAYYRIYLEGTDKKINHSALVPVFEKINHFFDWFIANIPKEKVITLEQETGVRKEIRNYHKVLLNELHMKKNIDHSFLTFAFFTIEMMDATMSFLTTYKKNYE